MRPTCPLRVRTLWPVAASHRLTFIPQPLADTRYRLSGLNATPELASFITPWLLSVEKGDQGLPRPPNPGLGSLLRKEPIGSPGERLSWPATASQIFTVPCSLAEA